MNKKLIGLSTVFLLYACSNRQDPLDSSLSIQKEKITTEKEESKKLPLLIGSWVDDSEENFSGVQFLELEEDYASFSMMETDNILRGPIIEKEQTEDTLTFWMYQEKDNIFEIPESLIYISLPYEEMYGEVNIKSEDNWLVPTQSTDLDMSTMNLISNKIPEYSEERVKEIQQNINTYITYEEAEKLFEKEMESEDLSFEKSEYNVEFIRYSDDSRPFYTIEYEAGNSKRAFDFVVFADTGETEVRKNTDKLYTFETTEEEVESEKTEEKQTTITNSTDTEDIIKKYNDLSTPLKVLLATTTVDDRATSPYLEGFNLYYNFDSGYLLVNVHSGAGSGHPWYVIQYEGDKITPVEGVSYMGGGNNYADSSVDSTPVSKEKLHNRYMESKDSYDGAVKKMIESPEMTISNYQEMRSLINQ